MAKTESKLPVWLQRVSIPMMLISGTITTVVQKFMLEQKAKGASNREPHKFNKPWFLVLVMFVGELLALIIYKLQPHCGVSDRHLEGLLDSDAPPPRKSTTRIFLVIAIPSLCDLIGTAVMSVGLLYIQASFWTMLRGALTIFSAILDWAALKRPQRGHMWAGVVLVTLALCMVGLAAVCSSGVAVEGASSGQTILAVFLTVGAQFARAVQVILEDYFLHDVDISPYLIVGMEGFWGLIGTLFVFLPIVQFLATPEGNGVHEDSIDTCLMLKNMPSLIGWTVLYIAGILGLNMAGMLICEFTNAVMRTIIESMRTLCIWVVQLMIYYGIRNQTYGHHHPSIGEQWTDWSWTELAGFGLLVTGLFVYRGIVKLPGFTYQKEWVSP
jgi:hypothetical protein